MDPKLLRALARVVQAEERKPKPRWEDMQQIFPQNKKEIPGLEGFEMGAPRRLGQQDNNRVTLKNGRLLLPKSMRKQLPNYTHFQVDPDKEGFLLTLTTNANDFKVMRSGSVEYLKVGPVLKRLGIDMTSTQWAINGTGQKNKLLVTPAK